MSPDHRSVHHPDPDDELAGLLRRLVNDRKATVRTSMTEIAAEAAMSKQKLSDLQNGKRPPHPVDLEHILRATGATHTDAELARALLGQIKGHAGHQKGTVNREFEPSVVDDGLDDARGGKWRPTPRQLPAAVADFVGRSRELEILAEKLEGMTEGSGAMVITSIGGTAGVGKTALALSWGHRENGRFPDGQLYVNLRGYGPDQPRRSSEVLALFLEALGVPTAQMPADEDARAALYRSLLAGRKALVVLDNAATAEQVRPLLPGSSACLVVVTSRSELPGLVAGNGARRIVLDRLSPDEAVELLRRIIGQNRVDQELDAAKELAHRCAYLPLALRVAATWALAGPGRTLAEINDELAQRRLDLLATLDNDQNMDVRAVFSWSYEALPAEAARLYRLLGLHGGPEISVPAVAALAQVTTAEAGHLLEVLAGVHLLERARTGRYRFHDLLREYAAEQAAVDESEPTRRLAVRRILDWYLRTASAGYQALMVHLRPVPLDSPDWACPTLVFQTAGEALEWYENERSNLVAMVRQAAGHGEHTIAWKLAAALSGYFQIRKPWDDWIATANIGLSSAQLEGNKHGQSWSLCSLGIAYWGLRRYDDAEDSYRRAVNLCLEIGDHWGEGILLSHLGDVHRNRGQPENAIEYYQKCQGICGIIDESWGRWAVGFALHNLGLAYRDLGQYDEAISCFEQTLQLSNKIGNDPWGKAQTLHHLGDACCKDGRLRDAVERYQQALALRRTIGDQHGEATTLNVLGIAQHAIGESDAAAESLHQALTIFTRLGDPQAHDIQNRMHALHERAMANGRAAQQ